MEENKITDTKKLNYILKTEMKITFAIFNGHKASDNDQFSKERKIIEQYRKDLKIIK